MNSKSQFTKDVCDHVCLRREGMMGDVEDSNSRRQSVSPHGPANSTSSCSVVYPLHTLSSLEDKK